MEKTFRNLQCKCQAGISCRWTIGKSKDGGFKALSVRSARKGFPSAFLPFEIMDAVMNRNIRFDSMDAAEAYVRSL